MKDILLTALAPLFWGTSYFVITQLIAIDMPIFVALMRALPVGLLLLLFSRKLPRGQWWWRAFLLGVFNIGLFFYALFFAAYRMPGGIVATIGALLPLVVMLLSWPLLGQKPHWSGFLGAALGVSGVGLLIGQSAISLDGQGLIAIALGLLSMGLGMVLTRKWGRPVELLPFTAWQLIGGGIFLLPLTLIFEPSLPALTPLNWLGLAWMGLINTALGYVLWFRGIEKMKPSRVSFLSLLSPLTAIVIGALLLRQTLNLSQVGGMLLIFLSLVISSGLSGTKRKNTAAPGGGARLSEATAPGESGN